jgi:hypothetical protein
MKGKRPQEKLAPRLSRATSSSVLPRLPASLRVHLGQLDTAIAGGLCGFRFEELLLATCAGKPRSAQGLLRPRIEDVGVLARPHTDEWSSMKG